MFAPMRPLVGVVVVAKEECLAFLRPKNIWESMGKHYSALEGFSDGFALFI